MESRGFPRRDEKYTDADVAESELIHATVYCLMQLDLLRLSGLLKDSLFSEGCIAAKGAARNETHGHQNDIYEADVMRTVRECIDTIVPSIEYCLQPDAGVLTATMLVFPVMVALGLLSAWQDPRVEYVMALMKHYQLQTGVPLAELLTESVGTGFGKANF